MIEKEMTDDRGRDDIIDKEMMEHRDDREMTE